MLLLLVQDNLKKDFVLNDILFTPNQTELLLYVKPIALFQDP